MSSHFLLKWGVQIPYIFHENQTPRSDSANLVTLEPIFCPQCFGAQVSRNTELGNGIWDSVRRQRSQVSPHFWVRGEVNATYTPLCPAVGAVCSTPWWFSTDHAQCRRKDHVCAIPNGSQWFNWSHPPTQQWWLRQYTGQAADAAELERGWSASPLRMKPPSSPSSNAASTRT